MPPIVEVMNTPPNKRQGTACAIRISDKADVAPVTVHLSDVNREETLPDRIITLKPPTWTFEIGRGSSSDDTIIPGPDNAWFTSKVMSRQHAILKADPNSKLLTICDANSMHGTYLNGDKVGRQPVELLEDDIITFGTEIVRQAESFAPLKTRIAFEWESSTNQQSNTAFNCFTADYSEEDIYSDYDDEIEIVKETLVLDPVHERQTHREPSLEILGTVPSSKQARAPSSVTTSPSMKSNSGDSSSSSNPTSTQSVLAEKQDNDLDARLDSEADELFGTAPIPVTVVEDASERETDIEGEYDEEEDIDAYEQEYEEEDEGSGSDQENIGPSEHEYNSGHKTLQESFADSSLAEPQQPRQPSPSDAAMAKAPWISEYNANMPSSRLYAPSAQCNSFTTGSSWSGPPYFNTQNTSLFGQPNAYVRANPKQFLPPPIASPFASWSSHPPPPPPPTNLPFWSSPANTSNAKTSADSLDNWRARPDASMVERLHKLKRKADDMCIEQEANTEPGSFSSPQQSAYLAREPSQVESDPAAADAMITTGMRTDKTDNTMRIVEESNDYVVVQQDSEDATKTSCKLFVPEEPVEESDEQSARKRVKLDDDLVKNPQNSSSVRTFAKYAATALVGATAGAIGTVVGLASLPHDYFA